MSLLDDLERGEAETAGKGPTCGICEILSQVKDPATKEALSRAAAGTMGRDKLASILRKNGYPTSWRQVKKHRLHDRLTRPEGTP